MRSKFEYKTKRNSVLSAELCPKKGRCYVTLLFVTTKKLPYWDQICSVLFWLVRVTETSLHKVGPDWSESVDDVGLNVGENH